MEGGRRPHLLLTNDDGIDAPGLHALADELKEDFELLIVAPHRERSATGHAISVLKRLRLERFSREGVHWGWSFEGKPADCVKVALTQISKDRPIDLVLSGINLGQNLGINILYSGTVAAAREAVILGTPSIAFSLSYRDPQKIEFKTAARVARDLTHRVLEHGTRSDVFLNVNIPSISYEKIKGYTVTRQGMSCFPDQFEESIAEDESEVQIFRNVGRKFNPSEPQDLEVDDHAVHSGYVSITPLHIDSTAHHALEDMKKVFP